MTQGWPVVVYGVDAGVVRQCAKGGANTIRAPAPTVPGPRPAHRPEHTNVAMDHYAHAQFSWRSFRIYGSLPMP